ncbi:hypothetical protein D3C81_1402050 [compost metagenome]
MKNTNGTTMYHAEESNRPLLPAETCLAAEGLCGVRRMSSVQMTPNSTRTKVIHMNSTRQYRVPSRTVRHAPAYRASGMLNTQVGIL